MVSLLYMPITKQSSVTEVNLKDQVAGFLDPWYIGVLILFTEPSAGPIMEPMRASLQITIKDITPQVRASVGPAQGHRSVAVFPAVVPA
jgi:hypothetical protein